MYHVKTLWSGPNIWWMSCGSKVDTNLTKLHLICQTLRQAWFLSIVLISMIGSLGHCHTFLLVYSAYKITPTKWNSTFEMNSSLRFRKRRIILILFDFISNFSLYICLDKQHIWLALSTCLLQCKCLLKAL